MTSAMPAFDAARHYARMLEDARRQVREHKPWDLSAQLQAGAAPLLLDVREPDEFAQLFIPGSINIPRGILEQACCWDFDETEPRLAGEPGRAIVVICRSGNRSLLAALAMQQLGFADVSSLALGIRGWNDAELGLVDAHGQIIDADEGDARLASRLRPEQRKPPLRPAP